MFTFRSVAGHELRRVYRERYHNQGSENVFDKDDQLILAPHSSEGLGRVYTLAPADLWLCHPKGPRGAIGQAIHGGVYYMNRFAENMHSLKQIGYLLHFCIREVGSTDPTVGGDVIDIATVQQGVAKRVPRDWSTEFADSYQKHSNRLARTGVRQPVSRLGIRGAA